MHIVSRSGGSAINQTRPSTIDDSSIYEYFNAVQAALSSFVLFVSTSF